MTMHVLCENCGVWFNSPPLDPKLHEALYRHHITKRLSESEFQEMLKHYATPEKEWRVLHGKSE